MQVSKTNSLITRGIAFVAAFAFAVTVFTPAIVSAQDASATTPAPATGFKANLTNKDTCIASFTANPNVAEVKKYGQERIDKRLATVEKLDKAVDKFYKERKSTYDDKADSIDVTLGRYADKDLKRKLPDADAHKKALNKNIADRKKLLKKFNGQLKEAGDQPAAIGAATCSAIIDGRIYNGLVAKYKQQTKLDRISMRNAINQARYDAAHGIKSGVKGMPNPEKNNDEIKSAQKLLNSDKSAQKEIDALEAKVIKKEAPDIAKDYKKVAADARAAKKAEQAKAQPQPGGGKGGGCKTGQKKASNGVCWSPPSSAQEKKTAYLKCYKGKPPKYTAGQWAKICTKAAYGG